MSVVGRIRGCGTVDTEEPRVGRAGCKLHTDFPLRGGSGASRPCVLY